MSEILLYGAPFSGHSHRVEVFLRLLGLPYRRIDADPVQRKQPEFLAMNALGQIPVLADGALVLADSTAILVYLARRYDAGGPWLPEDPVGAAQVQRWLSLASGELRYGAAQARAMVRWNREGDLNAARQIAHKLLALMEDHLRGRSWLAADHPTLADLAMYAYTLRAPEGGVSLEPYPTVRAWLSRLEALPGFWVMPARED